MPDHLLVVGGGYIGLELGSVWQRLGAKVTVIEFLPRIVPLADLEVGTLLAQEPGQAGARVPDGDQGHRRQGRQRPGPGHRRDQGRQGPDLRRREASSSPSAAAPIPTAWAWTEVGVKFDPKTGKVGTDSHFRTNVPTISAIGDLIDGPMLAHKAEDEGTAFAELLAGQAGHINYETIPSVIYTWPEMASVGITEEQAKDRKIEYKVGKFPFIANGRAKAMDEVEGSSR